MDVNEVERILGEPTDNSINSLDILCVVKKKDGNGKMHLGVDFYGFNERTKFIH